ncbi:unnamed protein product [Mytilus coruscus]|uniref:Uncharacterized protein n=1 Tax=Mytilus coruscus TaxID=42192 RepID=A0A6J8CW91_MYTCO|nr:unnamed protein product [Mytilus coruscus]
MTLRNKHKLKNSEIHSRVFIQGAKSHIERLLEKNARTILRELPQGKSYRISGNGRILKKSTDNDQIAENAEMETQQESAEDTSRLKEIIRLGHLNVCGWTLNNYLLRKAIVANINVDILSICETHLKESDKIAVDGNTWKGHNRNEIHRNAPKASGGVGLLIKQWILEEYKYEKK